MGTYVRTGKPDSGTQVRGQEENVCNLCSILLSDAALMVCSVIRWISVRPSVRCSIYFSDCLSICVSFWTLMDPPSWRMSVEKCLISFWRQWIVSSLVFLLCLRVSFYYFFCSHEDSCSCVCDFESIYWPSFSSTKNEGKFFSFLCLPNPNYRYKSLLETERENDREGSSNQEG